MSGLLINPYRFAAAIQHVADANARLSLTGISVGKHVIQDDNSVEYVYNGDAEAVQIIGAGTANISGYYTKRGTANGKPFYNLIGQPSDSTTGSVVWGLGGNSKWYITSSQDVGAIYYESTDAVAYPWLVTTWTQNNGDLPVPTTAHIASKNALTTCAFVSGAGTAAANGIYTERPGLGLVVGKSVYNLLGQTDDLNNYAITRSGATWRIKDSSGTTLYFSAADGTNYPWQTASWMEDAGDSPAPTVVSKTQGELDAGVLVTGAETRDANDVYLVTPPDQNRNTYTGIAHSLILADPLKNNWWIATSSPQSADGDAPAFPWEASFNDSATVAENPIASESNWLPLP